MKGELLELIPQKYLCPKCGKWHKYTWDQNLGYYDSSDYAIEMHCPNSFGIIEVYFANDRCYWNEGDQCYWCKISEFSEIGESRVQMIDSKNNFRLGFEFKPEEYAQVYAAEILHERHSENDVSGHSGVWRLSYCQRRNADCRSCHVCTLYRNLYQSDPDPGRAGRNDAKGSFRLPPFP